jgi:phosphate transport system permease protein
MVGIMWAIISRGWPALSWSFFTDQIRQAGADGGIFYNLIGSILLIFTALLVGTPFAFALALLHSYYLAKNRWQQVLGMLLYLLNGVPSILFGIFGMLIFVQWLGWGKSWLSGGILLAMMILPTVTIALAERIEKIPKKYLEAARGLGLRPSQVVHAVVLPQSFGGWVTGSLLGLARAAGETAPIMFTATIFAGASIPDGIKENPVLSLPYHIFILAQDSHDPAANINLWGTALTLLFLVLSLSAIALLARLKIHEESHH